MSYSWELEEGGPYGVEGYTYEVRNSHGDRVGFDLSVITQGILVDEEEVVKAALLSIAQALSSDPSMTSDITIRRTGRFSETLEED